MSRGRFGVIIIVILFAVFIFLSLNAGMDTFGSMYRDYTSYSTKESGYKASFLLLERLGFNVLRHTGNETDIEPSGVMLLIKPSEQIEMLPRLKSWIRGNTLIMADERSPAELFDLNDFDRYSKETGKESDYTYMKYIIGKGAIIHIPNYTWFSNRGLREVPDHGILLVRLVENSGQKNVYYNEYVHGYINDNKYSLWEIIGSTGRILVIQLLLGVTVLMLHLSGRFGRPVPLKENRRPENENITALAALYARANAAGLIMEEYLDNFMNETAVHADNDRVKEIIECCRDYIEHGKGNKKKMMVLIAGMDKIRRELIDNG